MFEWLGLMVVVCWIFLLLTSVSNQSGYSSLSLYMGPFECGFSMAVSGPLFSVQFVKVLILFLIFDLELLLAMGVIWSNSTVGLDLTSQLCLVVFFIGLLLTLGVEYLVGAIVWV